MVKLGEICTTNIGLTFKPSNIVSTGVPVYKANNIKNGKINTIDLVFVSEKTRIKENEYLKENDILMAIRSGSKQLVGKTAVIEKLETRTSFGAFMSVIRTLVVIPTYVNYFFIQLFLEINSIKQIQLLFFQVTQKMLRNTLTPTIRTIQNR